ncbi:conserved hypothetical protein [Neospora caninum Liverpool]|nr:conserved hypothetical protein [Neospora caninum Liverpool]CBZ50052.1 conserved hypothetical protein [Neospora caninum Liverpool]|eukprot:XP_003880087.1 conserved hypothetical protein [Neospora caninum Liverpool]
MGAPSHPLFGSGKRGEETKDAPSLSTSAPPPPRPPPVLPPSLSPQGEGQTGSGDPRAAVGHPGERQGTGDVRGERGKAQVPSGEASAPTKAEPVHASQEEQKEDLHASSTTPGGDEKEKDISVSGNPVPGGGEEPKTPPQGSSPASESTSTETHAGAPRNAANPAAASDDAVAGHTEMGGVDTPPQTPGGDQGAVAREDRGIASVRGQPESAQESASPAQGEGAAIRDSPPSHDKDTATLREAKEGNGSASGAGLAGSREGGMREQEPKAAAKHEAVKKREGSRRGPRGPGFGRHQQPGENADRNDRADRRQDYPTSTQGAHTPESGVHTPDSGVHTPPAYPVPSKVGQDAEAGRQEEPHSTASASYYPEAQVGYGEERAGHAIPSHGDPPQDAYYAYTADPAAAYASAEPVQRVYGDGRDSQASVRPPRESETHGGPSPSGIPHWDVHASDSGTAYVDDSYGAGSVSLDGIDTREDLGEPAPAAYSYSSSRDGGAHAAGGGNCRDPQVLEPTLEEHCDAWCTTAALKHWEGSRPVWASLHLNPVPSFFADLRTGLFVFLYRHKETFFAAKAHLEREARDLGAFLAEKNEDFREAYPSLWVALWWVLGCLLLSRLLTGDFVPRSAASLFLCCLGGRNGFCERRRRMKEEQRAREEAAQAVVDGLLKNQQIKWLLTQTKKTSFICEKLKGSVLEVCRTDTEEKLTRGGSGGRVPEGMEASELARVVGIMQREQEDLKRLLHALQEEQRAERASRQAQLAGILAETKKQFDSATLQQAQYSLVFLQALGRIMCAVDPTYSSEEKEQLEASIARDAAAIQNFLSSDCPDEVNDTYELGNAPSAARSSFADETFNHLVRSGMTPRGLSLASSCGFSAGPKGNEERDNASSPSMSLPVAETAERSAGREHPRQRERENSEEAKARAGDLDESRHSSAQSRQDGPRGVVPPNLFDASPPGVSPGFSSIPPDFPPPFPAAPDASHPPPLPLNAAQFAVPEESLSAFPGSEGVASAPSTSHSRPPLPPQGLRDPFASPLPPSADIEGGSGVSTHRLRSSSVGSVAGSSSLQAKSAGSPVLPPSNGVYAPMMQAPGTAASAGNSAGLGNEATGAGAPLSAAPALFAGQQPGPSAPPLSSVAPSLSAQPREAVQRAPSGASNASEMAGVNGEENKSPENALEEKAPMRGMMNGTAPPLPPSGLKQEGPPQAAAARQSGRILRERREPPKVQAATNPFGIPPPASAPLSSGMDF